MPTTVILALQLFFASGEEIRAEVPMSSLEECLDAAQQAHSIRQHQGKATVAVAVTCYAPTKPQNPA
jgi:hypothetical protein